MVKTKSYISVTEITCNRALLFALVNRLLFLRRGREGGKGRGAEDKEVTCSYVKVKSMFTSSISSDNSQFSGQRLCGVIEREVTMCRGSIPTMIICSE